MHALDTFFSSILDAATHFIIIIKKFIIRSANAILRHAGMCTEATVIPFK
jgi:hypothetical protein